MAESVPEMLPLYKMSLDNVLKKNTNDLKKELEVGHIMDKLTTGG
jgi:predicted glycosyltransferase